MKLSSLKRYLKSKEATHPGSIRLIKKISRMVPGIRRPSYPVTLGREIAAVAEVLSGPFWNLNYGRGLVHEKLEEEFAAYVGTRYAVAVNTGGMAIQMALRAFGLKPGDEVVHQVDTCVANAFAVMAAGVTPIFADINKDDFLLEPASVEDQVSPQTRVIMPVHMWGNPENMDWIRTFASQRDLYVLEDACLSLGAEWKGRRTGSSADAGVFSFGCLKPIQAGEGGMIVTDDEALARELRVIRNWGDTTTEYGVRDQRTLSWNGRISEIVAAVALEQLRGYPKYFSRLQEHVAIFVERLNSIDGIDIAVAPSAQRKPAYTQIVVKLDGKALGVSKTELMKRLTAAGVGVWHANFEPINTLSFFTQGKWQDWVLRGDLNRVERNYNHKFINSQEVYESLGMGFVKDNFLSRNRVRSLIKKLELALVRQT
jgi:dTDP-4-amino-4,6-dideoxygalactose transaminase